jgi:hypothetical protein
MRLSAAMTELRSLRVAVDQDELEITVQIYKGITTRQDWRDLSWVLSSSAWPAAWSWSIDQV